MSRTIVQVIAASELRAGDVIVNVHEDIRATVADVLRGTDHLRYWQGDDSYNGIGGITVTFADRSADTFNGSEPVIVEPRDRSIMVYRTRWTPEDDGHGGTTEPDFLNDTREEVIDCEDGADTIDTTILYLRDLGLLGNSEHVDRYIDPDGSRTIDYGTAEREIVLAVLRDFSAEEEETIRGYIGSTD